MTQVGPGDTVIVLDGTYVETDNENASGTPSAPITFKAQNQWGAVIAPNSGGEIISVSGNYVTIQGFEIIGNSAGTNNDGIKFQPPGTGGQALNNKIHNIGTGNCTGGAPIISGQSNSVIDSNMLYNYGEPGCSLYEGIYLNDGNNQTVTNNLIGDAPAGTMVGIQVNGQEAQTANFPSNQTIANNTLFNINGYGTLIACWGGNSCSGNVFNNNILYNAGVAQASVRTAANGGTFTGSNSFSNNLIFNSGSPSMANGQNLVNTISSNPMFVNYTGDQSGNYQLQSGSPAIGAGTTNGAPSNSFGGGQRVPPIWDGAYQSSGGGGSPPPPANPSPPTGLTATVN